MYRWAATITATATAATSSFQTKMTPQRLGTGQRVLLLLLVAIKLAYPGCMQLYPGVEANQSEPSLQNQDGSGIDTCLECDWDYEPRVWSHEQRADTEKLTATSANGDGVGIGIFDDHPIEVAELGEPEIKGNEYVELEDEDITASDPYKKGIDPRRMLNYLRENSLLTQPKEEKERNPARKCTQFKVDTREAIVCDGSRCDKFNFEWPAYDNQLVLIQTTRHGMRFHRQDFAFQKDSVRVREVSDHKRHSTGTLKANFDWVEQNKVKIDLLDLFKPRPKPCSTSTTPIPSRSTTRRATKAPETSTSTTTSTTTTETTPSSTSTSPESSTNDRPEKACDGHHDKINSTKLVTTFRLSTKRRRQQMVGFGGALTDATCRNIKSLSAKMADCLMDDYYGDSGLRYNIARVSIGSSDFSTTPYTNNDKLEDPTTQSPLSNSTSIDLGSRQSSSILDGDDDVEMNNFRLTSEDYEFKLPVARQAIATSRQEIKFVASLWSPPVWMKNNSHIVHGYLKGDVYGPYYKALAELMIKWLESYRKNGLEFWALTGINEPVTGVKPFIFHNSLGITRDDYIKFYKLYLGPLLHQRGFANLNLFALDDNKGYAPNWARNLLSDRAVAKYVTGIAFHWYMNDEYENLDFLQKYYPEKLIISSEACNGFLPFQAHPLPGNWDRGVAYMYDMLRMIQKGSSAWIDWNMALDLNGGPTWARNYLDAAILVNARLDEYYKSPMFYAIGHFSKFVAPNSTRLDYRLQNGHFDYPLEAVGFHTPDNHIIVVVLNANRHLVPFRLIVDGKLIRLVNLRAESFNTIAFRWKGANVD